jgi:hypothetical protein
VNNRRSSGDAPLRKSAAKKDSREENLVNGVYSVRPPASADMSTKRAAGQLARGSVLGDLRASSRPGMAAPTTAEDDLQVATAAEAPFNHDHWNSTPGLRQCGKPASPKTHRGGRPF